MKVQFAAWLVLATSTSSASNRPRRIRKASTHLLPYNDPINEGGGNRESSVSPIPHRHRTLLEEETVVTNPSDYNDEWWADLPPYIQQAFTVLGWDQYQWDMGLYPPSENMLCDQLTPEMQNAAAIIGYTQETWDNTDDTDNGIESYAWCGLPTYIQEAAILLGWSEEAWDNNEYVWSDRVYWSELTTKQKKAAIILGYDEESWDDSVAVLLAMEEETTIDPVEEVAIQEEMSIANNEIVANQEHAVQMSLAVLEMSVSALHLQLETSLEASNNDTEEMSMSAAAEETSLSVQELSLSAPTTSQAEITEMTIDEGDGHVADMIEEVQMSLSPEIMSLPDSLESSIPEEPLELESILTTEVAQLETNMETFEMSMSALDSFSDVETTESLDISISMPESSISITTTLNDEYLEQSMPLADSSISLSSAVANGTVNDNDSSDEAINMTSTHGADKEAFEADFATKDESG
jgi:hypothetical protein